MIVGMKTVAVIGASTDRRKFGNKAVRAFRAAGYRVIPITPRHSEIEGEPAFATVLDFPGTIDMATVYVPPAIGEHVVESLAQKGIGEVWFNPGADGPAVLNRARALGIRPIQACSIVGIGMSPSQF
jgi:predicted CoA-binding protein